MIDNALQCLQILDLRPKSIHLKTWHKCHALPYLQITLANLQIYVPKACLWKQHRRVPFPIVYLMTEWLLQCAGKNWMYFETGLRDFAVARSLDLSLYTGTHGVGGLLFVTTTIIIEILIWRCASWKMWMGRWWISTCTKATCCRSPGPLIISHVNHDHHRTAGSTGRSSSTQPPGQEWRSWEWTTPTWRASQRTTRSASLFLTIHSLKMSTTPRILWRATCGRAGLVIAWNRILLSLSSSHNNLLATLPLS